MSSSSSSVPQRVVVIGAGAMGAALASHRARAGGNVSLAGTSFDNRTIEECRSSRPHPALGVRLPESVDCYRHDEWDEVIPSADILVIAVSSEGLRTIVSDVASRSRPDALWGVATKGWDSETLLSPSQVVAEALRSTERVAVLGGPAVAPELAAGAPMSLVCAASHVEIAEPLAGLLRFGDVSVRVTVDVAGTETASAYKNVVAIAVGMAEGLGERRPESVYVHRFANARAATFAIGLLDMTRLAQACGGRAETIIGLAGAGDLYVTCLSGRNGSLGRLIGSGQTVEEAQATIGSTVEGVANTAAALSIAGRLGVDLPTARAVHGVLHGEATPEDAVRELLRTAR